VVQDASDAFPEMPTTALTRLEPEHVIGIAGMPRVEMLTKIHRQPCTITRHLASADGGVGSRAAVEATETASAVEMRRPMFLPEIQKTRF